MKRAQLIMIILLVSICLIGCRRMGSGGLFGRRGAPCGNYAPYGANPYGGNPYGNCAPAAVRGPVCAPPTYSSGPGCPTGACGTGGYTAYSSGAFGAGPVYDGGTPMEMAGPDFEDSAAVTNNSQPGVETIGPGYSSGPAILTGVTDDRAVNNSNELPGPKSSNSGRNN